LLEADLVELLVEDISMLVEDVLMHELNGLELLVAKEALVHGACGNNLSFLLGILLLHGFQDGVFFRGGNLSDATINALLGSFELLIFEVFATGPGRTFNLTSCNSGCIS
jgi:hypothetical protein